MFYYTYGASRWLQAAEAVDGMARGRRGTEGSGVMMANGRAMPSRVGRRPLLTRPLIREVAKAVQRGAFLHVAAEASGIGRRTLFTWLERGRDLEAAGEDGGELTEQELLYVKLLHEITVAHAQARLKAEAAVLQKVPLAWLRFGPGRDRGPDAPGWTRAVSDVPIEVRSAAEVLLTQALTQLGLVPEAVPLTPRPPLPCTGEGEPDRESREGAEAPEMCGEEAEGREAGEA